MEVKGCHQLSRFQHFFKMSSFEFNRRKKLMQVWKDMRVSK